MIHNRRASLTSFCSVISEFLHSSWWNFFKLLTLVHSWFPLRPVKLYRGVFWDTDTLWPYTYLFFWYLSGNRKEQSKHLTSSTLGSPRSWTCSLMKRRSSPLPSGLSSLLLRWPLWHLDTLRSNHTIYRRKVTFVIIVQTFCSKFRDLILKEICPVHKAYSDFNKNLFSCA